MVSRKPPSSHALFSQRLDSRLSEEPNPPAAVADQPLSFENQQQGLTGHGVGGGANMSSENETDATTDAWRSTSTANPVQHDILPASLRPGERPSGDVHHSAPEKIPVSLQAGLAEFTPRSSWESERGQNPEAEAASSVVERPQDSTASRVPQSSTNPFRRPHETISGVAAPGISQYNEVSNANPWSTELGNSSTAPLPQNKPDDDDDDRDIWNKLPPSPPKKPASLAQPENPTQVSLLDQDDPSLSNHQWRQHAAVLGAKPIPNYTRASDSFTAATATTIPAVGDEDTARPPLQDTEKQVAFPTITDTNLQQQNEAGRSQKRDTSPYDLEPHTEPPFAGTPGPSAPPQQLLESQPSSHGVPGPSASPQQLLESTPPEKPPRPPQSTLPSVADSARQDTSTSSVSRAKLDKAHETYQIRLINWVDQSAPSKLRRSPIMVQNANGPCPLLALVNALVLSTPATTTTPLVETLRVREQVSLGLLLDAVIDELMSGRRGDAAQNLPDVSDLYAFLINLHTGMNVNPRFIAFEKPINLMDAPIDAPARANDYRRPGGFEQTREMNLYSTFAIPLIHGWIPPTSHPAFASLKRAAQTYEDAQNILFREEELEDKLRMQGLSQEEQIILQDIASIKYFLSSTATQLTGYGLDTVTESLAPGSLAILFRNDHFTTLYRHPRSGQLLTLVTDMGYAGHDEVVWESLVDVNGEGSEFYSGDFRPVGQLSQESQQQNGVTNPAADENEGWETVPTRSRRGPQSTRASNTEMPRLDTLMLNNANSATTNNAATISPTTEQEDHDLALAMQLQEEEEDRQRRSSAARRREDELSQAYLNNADASGRRTFPGFGRGAGGAGAGPSPGGIRPNVPPRGGSATANPPNRGGRPVVATHRPASASDDLPPPSYEQAAKTPTYNPPAGHPSHSPFPGAGSRPRPLPPRPGPGEGSSAYNENAGASAGRGRPQPPRVGRRTGEVSAGEGEVRRDKDCVIM